MVYNGFCSIAERLFCNDTTWIPLTISVFRIHIHIGCFVNLDDAILARQLKAKELFGDFINS